MILKYISENSISNGPEKCAEVFIGVFLGFC